MKSFPLSEVLSITTGKLLCDIKQIYILLSYLTGDEVYTHQIPRLCREVEAWILSQYPQLKEINATEINKTNWQEKLAELEKTYGITVTLIPMPREDHTHIDPIEELRAMVGDEKVVVVDLGERKK